MKKLFITFFVSVFSFSVSYSQSTSEMEVARATEDLRKAMIDADKTALEKLSSPKLSYGHSSGSVENKNEFVHGIVSGKSDFVTIDLTEQTISVSGNVAMVRHTLKAKTNNNGVAGEVNIKVLLIWQKAKNGWKLLARQAVKIA